MTVKINSIALWQDTLAQYSTEWYELHGENLRWTGIPRRLSSLSDVLEYLETIEPNFLGGYMHAGSGTGTRVALYCHLDPRYRTVVITI